MKSKKKLEQSLKIILFIGIASLMTGCVTRYAKPQLPPNLKHCDPLPVFNGEDFGDVVESYIELSYLYKDCSKKNDAKNVYFKEGA